jgi:hypothetical protein
MEVRGMKKKITKAILICVAVMLLMFAEYRFIMTNLHPYYGDCGELYIEIFDSVDVYDMID